MRYNWTEDREGYLCVASEWMTSWTEPEESRLVFRVAPSHEDNQYLRDFTPDFSGSILSLITGLGRVLRTEVLSTTPAHYIDRRPVPKPKDTRRKAPRMVPEMVRVTRHEWEHGTWRKVVEYEPADTCAAGHSGPR